MKQKAFQNKSLGTVFLLMLTVLMMQSCGRQLTYEGESYLIDPDGDGVDSIYDNCPNMYNPAPQADTDGNGIGDACDQPLGQAYANAVIVSAEKEEYGCQRVIVWEDLSNNEASFKIKIKYQEMDYGPYEQPYWQDYEEFVATIDVNDPLFAKTMQYTDNYPHDYMHNIYYKIITQYQDGSEQETNWLSSGEGCY
ncbi:MAG TPA: thrombospondin type 3 repeat-containing protein [Oligoflexia bacterium]|nr:thrombospondin type 3 repeat-containing protein [Oligoflexia bacterium]HMR24017.1 thrombospondin type 3 repeat-containing protein [Oligoflexia bacterium]